MRSAVWFALYAAVVAAPLLAATWARAPLERDPGAAFGTAIGWVALGLLAAEFALVTRVRSAAAAFGNDALLLFHRLMALVALAFLVLHVLLLAPGLPSPFARSPLERWGALAAWALALLVVSSLWRRALRWSYESWLLAHRLLALTVVIAMAAHVLVALGPEAHLPRVVASAWAALALAALAEQRLVRPFLPGKRAWELVSNRDQGASTRTLVLRAAGHDGLRFAPGQFVWLATPGHGWPSEEHPLSIASSPELDGGRTLELAVKALGDWSRDVVPALRPGAPVRVDGPFGAFTTAGVDARRFVFVAGGIGVTPMRSMLLAMRDRRDRRPIILFFAAHDRSRAMFADELESLQAELDLRVVFVFEDPGPDERCERGLVTTEILRRHVNRDLSDTHFFVCGPPPMMIALERIAAELGVSARQIHTERFDLV